MKDYDVFVSHASEDKDTFVRPLAAALNAAGLSVWYDEKTLQPGDNLRRSIDEGLSKSRYGLVVLSKAFFGKAWSNWELDGLIQRQVDGANLILPIWHGVIADEVKAYSPSLANLIAIRTSDGFANAINSILSVIKSRERPRAQTSFEGQKAARLKGPQTVLVSAIPAVNDLLVEFERLLLASEDDTGARELVLDNPRLLHLLLPYRRRSIVQSRPEPLASYSFDALALYAPQWVEVALVMIGSASTPPFGKDGTWSDELLEAVGTAVGWSHSSGVVELRRWASDAVRQHAEEWDAYSGFDSVEFLVSALTSREIRMNFLLLFGRHHAINEEARTIFHRSRFGNFGIELRTYDAVLRALHAAS